MSGDGYIEGGPATPDAPMRDWACNRCMYSWNGPELIWCPSCGQEATHGRAFAPVAEKIGKETKS